MNGGRQPSTKSRIIDAARAEFTEKGFSGARIDRIARAAESSKERLYAYFGDKSSLYREVLDLDLVDLLERTPFDDGDLTAFAVLLFDNVNDGNRTLLKELIWGQLHESRQLALVESSGTPWMAYRLDAIRLAQANGSIDPRWNPEDVFRLVFGIVSSWTITPIPSNEEDPHPTTLDRRRSAVERSVRLIFGA